MVKPSQDQGRVVEAINGNLDAYRRLYGAVITGLESNADYFNIQGMDPDGRINPAYERLLDVDNLIDYMIITYFTADADGPASRFTAPRPNNFFGIYNRDNPDGFKFFEHDSEQSLDTGDDNLVEPAACIRLTHCPLNVSRKHVAQKRVATVSRQAPRMILCGA